ncbi:MAG TPA: hypothetical protein DIT89_01300, partial [Planctomycetaceae bacterium]|nr:hypothetical protein [Planctomycetaceae bacterium]
MFKTQNIDVTELVLGVPGKTNVAWALAREVFSVAPTVARAFLPGSPFSTHKDAPHLTLTIPGHTVWQVPRGKTGVAAS